LKKFIILSLSLLTLLILIPSCITVQPPASYNTPPAVQTAQAAVIGNFSSNPSVINPGGTSNLSWNVTGANTVSIDNGIGVVNAAGSMAVSPASSTVYTITATNSAGTVMGSATTSVSGPVNYSSPINDGATRAPAVITNFSSSLNSDGTSTLSWNVTGADLVSIDQYVGVVSASGTKIVSASIPTVYTLTATWPKGNWTNDIGEVTRSVTTTTNTGAGTPWVQ